MPISALPAETVRLLGSPVVYTSPVSFVKELVDNAIDAKATAVEILISPNTIDSIEVRDNGHGIHPQDFGTIGHRGHTSKLRKFEDVQIVGPITLGFRGDALASAAALSTLTITTRTAGEPTASKLYFSGKGGVEKVERVSGLVGTSVKVARLFFRLPVRKQVALKEASKTISKIRELKHTYVFARPHLKLSLKILGHAKGSWSYTPGPHPSMREAALQIFGAELVSQCVESTISVAAAETNQPLIQPAANPKIQGNGDYVIEAFLPKPGADAAKISKWAFLAVDSRPVSFSKGTMKSLYSVFKARLSRHPESGGNNSINVTHKNPFLVLNIKCPPGSYDPNIEPSKDEVLFADSQHLVTLFERFLDGIYPAPSPISDVIDCQSGHDHEAHLPSPPSSDLRHYSLIEHIPSAPQRPTRSPHNTDRPSEPTSEPRVPTEGRSSTIIPNKNLHENLTSQGPSLQRLRGLASLSGVAGADPTRQQTCQARNVDALVEEMGGAGQEINDNTVPETNCRRREFRPAFLVDMSEEAAVKSRSGFAKPRTESNPWAIAKVNSTQNHSQPAAVRQDPVSPSLANPNLSRVPGGAFRSPVIDAEAPDRTFSPRAKRQPWDTHRHRGLATAFRSDDGEYQPRRTSRRLHSKPTRGDEGLVQATLDFSSPNYGKTRGEDLAANTSTDTARDIRPRAVHRETEPEGSVDLAALRRRQIVAENRRMRDQQLERRQDPEQSKTLRPLQAFTEPPGHSDRDLSKEDRSTKNGLPAGDARAYLMKRGCSVPGTTPRKLRRVKSCLLPLETTPAGYEIYNLVDTIHLDMDTMFLAVERAVNDGLSLTDPLFHGALGDRISRAEFEAIQRRVNDLFLHLRVDAATSDECQIEFISPSKLLGKQRQT